MATKGPSSMPFSTSTGVGGTRCQCPTSMWAPYLIMSNEPVVGGFPGVIYTGTAVMVPNGRYQWGETARPQAEGLTRLKL